MKKYKFDPKTLGWIIPPTERKEFTTLVNKYLTTDLLLEHAEYYAWKDLFQKALKNTIKTVYKKPNDKRTNSKPDSK